MSRAIEDATACREALACLPELDLGELRQRWRALYKGDASLHLSRELLVRAVAYRMPEAALGGLRPQRQRERPALQRLLVDIRAGRIDIVVVYKVDRLTRSLADFARLVELFDARAVSFVSVTQQFNTTSSMGRLTLNVLLSFAQFEREVTGERIRDKIAASKKKGMWMGGNVPLGYDASERTLVINPAEAETVRRVFALYRELGCVRRVKQEADRGLGRKAISGR